MSIAPRVVTDAGLMLEARGSGMETNITEQILAFAPTSS
jgi:hypothetical protein